MMYSYIELSLRKWKINNVHKTAVEKNTRLWFHCSVHIALNWIYSYKLKSVVQKLTQSIFHFFPVK
jgi:hypothetical protein